VERHPQIAEKKRALVENLQALQDISKDLDSQKLILLAVMTAQRTWPGAEARLKELFEVVKEEKQAAISDLERTAKRLEDI
jgi:hypothetical protein